MNNKLNPENTPLTRFIGVLPGKRMESIPDVKSTIGEHERVIQTKLNNLLQAQWKLMPRIAKKVLFVGDLDKNGNTYLRSRAIERLVESTDFIDIND